MCQIGREKGRFRSHTTCQIQRPFKNHYLALAILQAFRFLCHFLNTDVILSSSERYRNGLQAIRTHSFLSLGFCASEARLKLQVIFSVRFLVHSFALSDRHVPSSLSPHMLEAKWLYDPTILSIILFMLNIDMGFR